MAILGVVLAGGLSRRMGGGDKALLTLRGRTLLDRVTERFAPQCPAGLILSANGDASRFSGFPGEVVADTVPFHPGPLAGLLAALDHVAARHPGVTHVASVTGDSPFLPLDLVACLERAIAASGAALAIAASGERRHFTIGLWRVSLRGPLRHYLVEEGERRVGAFIARHAAADAEWPVGAVDPFLNINTPQDLAAAEAADALP